MAELDYRGARASIGQNDPAASPNKPHDEFEEVDQLTLKLIDETIKDLEELRTSPSSAAPGAKRTVPRRR
jgi:hypothetical protein